MGSYFYITCHYYQQSGPFFGFSGGNEKQTRMIMAYTILQLPPDVDLETKAILKKTAAAHRYLAELKGISATIPNENILINTLALQEAKDSSAVENIITTHDELYTSLLFENLFQHHAAKEVRLYADALKHGFQLVRTQKIISQRHILDIQKYWNKTMPDTENYRVLHLLMKNR